MPRVAFVCAALCAVAYASVARAANPPFTPPRISDTFSATVVVNEWPGPEVDTVMVYSDAANQRFLSVSNETLPNGDTVATDDLHQFRVAANAPTEYTYVSSLQQCTAARPPNDAFPSLFSWVKDAVYDGQTMVFERLVDVWTLNRDAGQFVMTLFTTVPVTPDAPVVPVRLSEFVFGANSTSLTLVLDFVDFSAAAPNPQLFAVPNYCDKSRPTPAPVAAQASLPLVRTGAASKAVAAMAGNLGIHWKCDICKAAAETLISVGCGGGSALCGPFAEVCEAMCEGGCLAAGCGDWACKKFGFC